LYDHDVNRIENLPEKLRTAADELETNLERYRSIDESKEV